MKKVLAMFGLVFLAGCNPAKVSDATDVLLTKYIHSSGGSHFAFYEIGANHRGLDVESLLLQFCS